MRFSLFMMGLALCLSVLPMQALRADGVRPLYQLSDDRMLSDQGRHRALPSFSTGANTSISFSSWKVGHVSPIAAPNAASTSSRIKLYSTGTDALPSESPLGIRRIFQGGGETNNGDDEEEELPEKDADQFTPVGSSAILVLFALLYAAYLAYRKRLTYTNR